MSYSKRTIKRILRDIKTLEECREDLEKSGIYFYYDPDTLGFFNFIIVGDEDTPYDGGIYPFKLSISKDPEKEYPFSPPHVEIILPNDGYSRMNPNLYCNGKVCLSMINTWEGDRWKPTFSLDKIMLAIKALVMGVKYPLVNEPGHDNDPISKLEDYNRCVEHQNFALAVIKMFETRDNKHYGDFGDIIYKIVMDKKDYYIERLKEYSKKYAKKKYFTEWTYNMKITNRYKAMLKVIKDLK